MDKARKLCQGEIIFVEALESFKSTSRVNQGGGLGAPDLKAPT